VVFGVPPGDRRTYRIWEEGQRPAVVFEITSRKTKKEDMGDKFQLYAGILKVNELFLFDPTEDYLKPSMIGYRRSRGELKPIKPADGRITSKVLGITLERNGTRLLLRDATTETQLLTRAEAAEAEVARLRKELDALRKKQSP
jgi:Uma2 family endonuclease